MIITFVGVTQWITNEITVTSLLVVVILCNIRLRYSNYIT